jgi:hypothetical protein
VHWLCPSAPQDGDRVWSCDLVFFSHHPLGEGLVTTRHLRGTANFISLDASGRDVHGIPSPFLFQADSNVEELPILPRDMEDGST